MNIIETPIKDLYVIEPRVFGDDRGYFFEPYNRTAFESVFGKIDWVQDNESKSNFGVVRGLHFQKPPFAQTKLVRCIVGEVFDVVVDCRKDSETFGQHFGVNLSAENKRQLFIPRGFAHGFAVISPEAIFAYKVDNVYNAASEGGVLWNDPALGIQWPLDLSQALLSPKDLILDTFATSDKPF